MIETSILLDGVELPYPPSVNRTGKKLNQPGLYFIFDKRSKRFYVGSASKTIKKRWDYHQWRLKSNTHPNHLMQSIYNKDKDRLCIEAIETFEEISKQQLLQLEQFLLDYFFEKQESLFMNVNKKATSREGVKSRPETCKKISESKTGLKHTDEAKQKMRAAKIGGSLSNEHKKKIGDAVRGKKINRPKGIYCFTLRRFTDDQIRSIRKRNANGESMSGLAREMQTCFGIIRRIIKRESYDDVE